MDPTSKVALVGRRTCLLITVMAVAAWALPGVSAWHVDGDPENFAEWATENCATWPGVAPHIPFFERCSEALATRADHVANHHNDPEGAQGRVEDESVEARNAATGAAESTAEPVFDAFPESGSAYEAVKAGCTPKGTYPYPQPLALRCYETAGSLSDDVAEAIVQFLVNNDPTGTTEPIAEDANDSRKRAMQPARATAKYVWCGVYDHTYEEQLIECRDFLRATVKPFTP